MSRPAVLALACAVLPLSWGCPATPATGDGPGGEGEGEAGGEGEGEVVDDALVRFNEVMTKNVGTIADPAGAFSDWIELFNPGAAPVSLDGWSLADAGSGPVPFIAGAVVPAGGFLVVWANDDATGGTAAAPAMPFKLSSAGETVTLRRGDVVIDQIAVPALADDDSHGRLPDGVAGTERLLSVPSPGLTNDQPLPAEGEGEGEGEGGVIDADVLVQSTASGCPGVFNPDQVLDYHLTMPAADWTALTANLTNDLEFTVAFACGSEAPIQAVVRRKRSGGVEKPGIKIDVNDLVPGQSHHGLKKLSFENGISEGSGDVEHRDVIAEYLAWRMSELAGGISGRAAFARLFVNGDLIGTYVNVEQIDKNFLRSRLGVDDGWLFKKSGSDGDGYKTNETIPNPFEATRCILESRNACPAPADLETFFPAQYHLDQFMRFGAVNALIANSDAPLLKDNNYIFYDPADGGPRLYIAWDLDTIMKDNGGLFGTSAPGGTDVYRSVLFAHWEDDYAALLSSLLSGPLRLAVIEAELDRVVTVAGAALDEDPAMVGDGAADGAGSLVSYWRTRHAQLTAELAAR